MRLSRIFSASILALMPQLAAADMQCDFLSENYFSKDSVAGDVISCLERGYTFALRDTKTGDTPLHLASKNLEDPFLLDQIALFVPDDVRRELVITPNSAGMNPFHLAVTEGRDTHFLANLARWGDPMDNAFDVDKTTIFRTRGTTALHLAMQDWSGSPAQVDRVLTLLALNAYPSPVDRNGKTPLDLAGEDDYAASLLLDSDAWQETVENALASLEIATSQAEPGCYSEIISDPQSAKQGYECLDHVLGAREEPESFWSLMEDGDNFLHRIVKSSPSRDMLDATLAAADKHGTLDAALSSQNVDGYTPLHLAAMFAKDPLTIVQLIRWGSDVDQLASPMSNGLLEAESGISPLHLAARRENISASTRSITALLAFGAKTNIYDNNLEANAVKEIGLTPVDYMNQSENIAAMALIGPGFSFCKKVDEYKGTAQAALGLGGGVATASGSATIASTAAGVTAVTHSSGAVILTGSSGYIGGTLGTFATSAFAFLTAPATLTAAGSVIVLAGGSVLYCSHTS